MDTAQIALNNVPLHQKNLQSIQPPQNTQKFPLLYQSINHNNTNNPFPLFETVIYVEENKKPLNPVKDFIILIRRSLQLFLMNIIYTMAIVSLNFIPEYNENFISLSEVYYFIVFFSFLSLTIIFVFGLSIQECARIKPFNIFFFTNLAVSLGFLLTLLQSPEKIIIFFTNLICIIIALNAILHKRKEMVSSYICFNLTIVNICTHSTLGLFMLDFTSLIAMVISSQIFTFYISFSFIPLVKQQNLIEKEDDIFLAIFIYVAIPLVLLKWLTTLFTFLCCCSKEGSESINSCEVINERRCSKDNNDDNTCDNSNRLNKADENIGNLM